MYERPGAVTGWHFLTGDEAQIKQLAAAVGFRYAYDAASKQFAHPSAIMVLTPDGRLARYFYGVQLSVAGFAAGIGGSVGRKDRLAGGSGAAVLLSTTIPAPGNMDC